MSNPVKSKATVCIVNYKTPDFIKLCLRSIRKFTTYPYEVIVVDNNSQDQSVEYLRALKWIRLFERPKSETEPGGGYAHAAALDLGLDNCNTEFFVSMHSDTFVIRKNWLRELVSYFDNDESIACVGAGKVELTAKWRVLLKRAADLSTFKRRLFGQSDPAGKHRYYNRTICCLYATEILRRQNLTFLMGRNEGLTAGKKLYFELVDRGYKTVELPAEIMGRYIVHLAHATQAVNPQDFTLRKRIVRKCNRLVDRVMSTATVRDILADSSLDA